MQIFNPIPGFSFCLASLGKDAVLDYMSRLPKIDLVYCAPPNPDSMGYWLRSAGKDPLSYSDFFQAWCQVIEEINPDELHVEVGSCQPLVETWAAGRYPYTRHQETTYAAPSTSRGRGMARTRRTFTRLSYSQKPMLQVSGSSSDAFLDDLLSNRPPMTCFDPCIGRGLLSRFALRHGHSCHGIEMNETRIRSAIAYVEDHHETT